MTHMIGGFNHGKEVNSHFPVYNMPVVTPARTYCVPENVIQNPLNIGMFEDLYNLRSFFTNGGLLDAYVEYHLTDKEALALFTRYRKDLTPPEMLELAGIAFIKRPEVSNSPQYMVGNIYDWEPNFFGPLPSLYKGPRKIRVDVVYNNLLLVVRSA